MLLCPHSVVVSHWSALCRSRCGHDWTPSAVQVLPCSTIVARGLGTSGAWSGDASQCSAGCRHAVPVMACGPGLFCTKVASLKGSLRVCMVVGLTIESGLSRARAGFSGAGSSSLPQDWHAGGVDIGSAAQPYLSGWGLVPVGQGILGWMLCADSGHCHCRDRAL